MPTKVLWKGHLALGALKTAVSGEQLNFGKHSTGRLQQKVLESQELSGIGRFKSLFRWDREEQERHKSFYLGYWARSSGYSGWRCWATGWISRSTSISTTPWTRISSSPTYPPVRRSCKLILRCLYYFLAKFSILNWFNYFRFYIHDLSFQLVNMTSSCPMQLSVDC